MVLVGPAAAHYEMGEEGLRAGTEGGTYTVRARPGEAGESFARLGVSLRRLVAESGADPEAIGYVVVPRPDGTDAYLPGVDLAEPSPFEAGLPVLVSADSGCIRFLRPATGPEDANGEDNIASCGASLTIGVRDGNVLTVRASASDPTPDVGKEVRFEASAEGARAGETVGDYRWSFGDGASAEGAAVTHAFTAAGSYKVTVTASGSAESGGESAPLTIVVGKPATTTTAGAGAGAATTKKKKNEAGAGSQAHHAKGKGRGTGKGEAVTGGPIVGPSPSRTAGRFGRGADDRSSGPSSLTTPEGGEVAPTLHSPEADSTPKETPPLDKREPQGEPAVKSEAEAVAPGRLVEGRLVADFIDASAAAPRGASGTGGASTAFAAAPANGARSVTAMLAAMLLAAGGAFEWRRQSKGRGQR